MVKIRLMRMGATKRPFYRVVVADSRSPRDGRFIENIGKYHPLEDPSLIEIDEDRAMYWLTEGAQPTEQARALLKIQGIWARFESERPGTAKKVPRAGAGAKKPAAAAKRGESGHSPAEESGTGSGSDGAAS
jgi:small subunit ribosomal protein S16